MNCVPFLIDSNVLIDVSRGKAPAIKYVDALPEPWSNSQVTAMELIVGARDKRNSRLSTVSWPLALYQVVPLSESIGAGAYRLLKTYAKSHGLHLFDSLIAATANRVAVNCPSILSMRFLAMDFREAITSKDRDAMLHWIRTTTQSGNGPLVRFAYGLRRDFKAVIAAVETSWSNGQTEGQINRLKAVKRKCIDAQDSIY